jgi:hypothetical protein
MCLSNVTEKYDHPSSLIVDGWKDFSGTDTKPRFQAQTLAGHREVPLDQWLKAEGVDIKADDGKRYELGFHVYTDEPKSSTRRRVFTRFISARGDQGQEKIAIAREMYVPSDPNGWPPKPGEPAPKKASVLDKAKQMLKPGNA